MIDLFKILAEATKPCALHVVGVAKGEQLKDKEVLSFEDWLYLNYTEDPEVRGLYKNDKTFFA